MPKFDYNQLPGQEYPPAPGYDMLSAAELELLQVYVPGAFQLYYANAADPFNVGITPMLANGLRQAISDAMNAQGMSAEGIRPPAPADLIPGGVSDIGRGGGDTGMPPGPGVKQFPATIVPKSWRMRHQSARGGHIAYLGQTEAAFFPRKKSANLFVRAWNDMIAHLGSASQFDQLRLTSLFGACLDAGSGANGVANGFRPPLNGQ